MKLNEVKSLLTELRGLSAEELATREQDLKKELFDLRFQAAAGQLENTVRLNEVKKTIARVKTVQREAK
ncbi:MAG: 50S ribosomal protein L29 [Pseudolactococcus laudensis]|jgi:large subunit ribosomal protein L29|uniref:Large ribosomal subunit protein uL29 n=6 Tax=Pseudolactococcus TaxID=3436058 RepID=A0A6A0BBE0_9LACT|nr:MULTISPECIES: 50S ribosomal protein L29 [Lactococcus]MBP6983976.1 50S ribosomal protein L29 [Lactococcus sp.]MDN6069935.1 50S ribosomal protein L29 [Lactococcus plantarum]NCB80933.1 50S ribosomal protein L29 [Bacilli bacterium]CCK19315.1 LSU ribosomal protein L29p (L35e) [Lactococcus raffinolactis 4877]ATC61129.1 50S ribosomal protein L29 [Lactococcus raffinolactis]